MDPAFKNSQAINAATRVMKKLAAADGKVFYTGFALQRPGMPSTSTGIFGSVDTVTGAKAWEILLPNVIPRRALTLFYGDVWFAVSTTTAPFTKSAGFDERIVS